MQQFLLRVLLYLLLLIVVGVVGVMLPDYGHEQNLLYSLRAKHERIEQTSSPRLVFLGGSNLAFGLDSKAIEDAFNMPAVNMGVHAGLGMRFIIEDAKPFLRSGDIVILVPEYPHFYDRYPSLFYGQDELLVVAFDVLPGESALFNFKQWSHIYQSLPLYIGTKYFNFFKFMNRKREYKGVKVAYRLDAINEYTDIVAHLDMPPQPIAPLTYREDDINPDVITYLNEFHDDCEAKGIQTFMAMTSFRTSSCDTFDITIDKLETAFANDLKIEMLAEPRRYCLPDEWFFDTHEHLTGEGRRERTNMLIEDIRQKLNQR